MASLSFVRQSTGVTFVCALFVLFSVVFAGVEIQIAPTQSTSVTLNPSNSDAVTNPLLRGTGPFTLGAASGYITYDFKFPIRVTRIELTTSQSLVEADTTHLIEGGVTGPNMLFYNFSSTTVNLQILRYTFLTTNNVIRILRINTPKSAGGVAWKSVFVYGIMEQFIPPPATLQNWYYGIQTTVNDAFTTGDNLLRGTGEWNSGRIAVPSDSTTSVTVTIDLSQVNRLDYIELVCRQQISSVTTVTFIYGTNDITSTSQQVVITFFNGVTSDGTILSKSLTAPQYRYIKVVTTNSGGNTVGWKSIKIYSARVNPEIQFYANTWGAATFFAKTEAQTVNVPSAAYSATVFGYGAGGGGGYSGVTGLGGQGAYVGGTLSATSNLQVFVGNMGANGTASGGFAGGQAGNLATAYRGGNGGVRDAGGIGGGGGGGATVLRSGSNDILVIGGGGGAGSSVGTNLGGSGGLAGPVSGSGGQGKGSNGGSGGTGGTASSTAGENGSSNTGGGGGGGGGGVSGGGGGGSISASTGSGAGGGGAGSSVASTTYGFTTATFQIQNIAPMPGALQIIWDIPTVFFWCITQGPHINFGLTANQYQLGYMLMNGTGHWIPYAPVHMTVFGTAATFVGGATTCTTYMGEIVANIAYCTLQFLTSGDISVLTQTPVGQHEYISDTVTITIT